MKCPKCEELFLNALRVFILEERRMTCVIFCPRCGTELRRLRI